MTPYLKMLAERVLVAFASAFLAALGSGPLNILEVPWENALGLAGGAALIALVGSVAGGALTSSNQPALTSKETAVEVEKPATYAG